jgi:hypothetical protein
MTYAKKKFTSILGNGEFKYQDIWRGKARLVAGEEFENGL